MEGSTSLTGYRGSTKTGSYSLYQRDHELIEWCAEYLGCKKSDVIRTAVRTMATQLASLNLKGTKPLP